MGLAMGATAIALIYSPWGKRSGAHMNPAMTLTFLRLGKIEPPRRARSTSLAQFAGGRRRRAGRGARCSAAVVRTRACNYVVDACPGPAGVAARSSPRSPSRSC